jgi:hypothetical protein
MLVGTLPVLLLKWHTFQVNYTHLSKDLDNTHTPCWLVHTEPSLDPTSASMSQNTNNFYMLAIKKPFKALLIPNFHSPTSGQLVMAVFTVSPGAPAHQVDPQSLYYYEVDPGSDHFHLLKDEVVVGIQPASGKFQNGSN